MAIDLATIGSLPITILYGEMADDVSGNAVSGLGDINGDGVDDFIIAALRADGLNPARPQAGSSYVVFGTANGLPATIDLGAVAAGTGGFVIHGEDAGDQSGLSISSAGDFNGDGFKDMFIGTGLADGPSNGR